MFIIFLLLPLILAASSTDATHLLSVPSALQALYDTSKGGTKTCPNGATMDTRTQGYETNGSDEKLRTHYCGEKKTAPAYVYWVSNMDIDCDGSPGGGNKDCELDQSYQSQTAFQDPSGKDIDATQIPYIVIDQDSHFDPQKFSIQPLSLVAVVCGGKLTYGVWADTNERGSMGEGSLKLGQTCFGSGINGNSGHDEADVLYVAFAGTKAETVPGGSGSDWTKLESMGNTLMQKHFGGGPGAGSGSSTVAAASSSVVSGSTKSGKTKTGSSTASAAVASSSDTQSEVSATDDPSTGTAGSTGVDSSEVATATSAPSPGTPTPILSNTATSLPTISSVLPSVLSPTSPTSPLPTTTTMIIGGIVLLIIVLTFIGILITHHECHKSSGAYAKTKRDESESSDEDELGKGLVRRKKMCDDEDDSEVGSEDEWLVDRKV